MEERTSLLFWRGNMKLTAIILLVTLVVAGPALAARWEWKASYDGGQVDTDWTNVSNWMDTTANNRPGTVPATVVPTTPTFNWATHSSNNTDYTTVDSGNIVIPASTVIGAGIFQFGYGQDANGGFYPSDNLAATMTINGELDVAGLYIGMHNNSNPEIVVNGLLKVACDPTAGARFQMVGSQQAASPTTLAKLTINGAVETWSMNLSKNSAVTGQHYDIFIAPGASLKIESSASLTYLESLTGFALGTLHTVEGGTVSSQVLVGGGWGGQDIVQYTATPEPATMGLLLLGGLFAIRRRK
jgi:hypothetical protein